MPRRFGWSLSRFQPSDSSSPGLRRRMMPMPNRIITKPITPNPMFKIILSRNKVGRLAPVTGIKAPGVEVAVGVGLESCPVHGRPKLAALIDLVWPSAGSIHIIASVLGNGPSMGESKLMVLLAGTTSGPLVAVPPRTHQTMFTE